MLLLLLSRLNLRLLRLNVLIWLAAGKLTCLAPSMSSDKWPQSKLLELRRQCWLRYFPRVDTLRAAAQPMPLSRLAAGQPSRLSMKRLAQSGGRDSVNPLNTCSKLVPPTLKIGSKLLKLLALSQINGRLKESKPHFKLPQAFMRPAK